jgi:hypothetical protein
MSVSVKLECTQKECTRSLVCYPRGRESSDIEIRYYELLDDANNRGWNTELDLCPEHARSSLENFLRSTMAPLVPVLDSAKQIAKALEDEYLLIPKSDVIDHSIERSDFFSRSLMTVRYKQPR